MIQMAGNSKRNGGMGKVQAVPKLSHPTVSFLVRHLEASTEKVGVVGVAAVRRCFRQLPEGSSSSVHQQN